MLIDRAGGRKFKSGLDNEHRLLLEGPKFDSRHLYGDSKPSMTPVPGDLSSSAIFRSRAHMWYKYKHTCT